MTSPPSRAVRVGTHPAQEVAIKASKDAQLLLLQIQRLDSAITQLEHRRRTLPELGELQRLSVSADELEDALVAAETAVSDLETEQARAESDLEPVRERLTRNRKRIADGTVSDPKALSSLIQEVEHLEKRIHVLEDAELEVMESLEEAVSTGDRRRAERAVLTDRETGLLARRDEQLTALDTEMAACRDARAALVPQLPADLLALYTRVAASHSGVGAAELVQRRCTGCRLEINAADLRTFVAAPPDEVLRCEECSRILVRTDQSGL
ncbi:MAG: C4-type zinc ribbon domain-containing protein [Microlunatus sp.]|nr:C4-type zinc ribbon domain-containing protein [Microlunatus sp.]MDN5770385.1 C4-type zinc ribbon domain-containing protein [Microlunatus sp.]